MKTYMTGFAFSALLTALPFWMLMSGAFERPATTAALVTIFAAAQIIFHIIYFRHMNAHPDADRNMAPVIAAIVAVSIALAGALWVMRGLDSNVLAAIRR